MQKEKSMTTVPRTQQRYKAPTPHEYMATIDTQPLQALPVTTPPATVSAHRLPRKRTFVARLLKKFLTWVQRIMEEDTFMYAAVGDQWARATKRCTGCQAVMASDTVYCSSCGQSQRKTERLRQVELQQGDTVSMTERLANIRLPGERPMDTYNRLVKKKI